MVYTSLPHVAVPDCGACVHCVHCVEQTQVGIMDFQRRLRIIKAVDGLVAPRPVLGVSHVVKARPYLQLHVMLEASVFADTLVGPVGDDDMDEQPPGPEGVPKITNAAMLLDMGHLSNVFAWGALRQMTRVRSAAAATQGPG